MSHKNTTDEMRKAAEIALKRAEEMTALHQSLPQNINSLNAYGLGLSYIADEIDRIEQDTDQELHINFAGILSPTAFNLDYQNPDNTLEKIEGMTVTLSGIMTSASGSVVTYLVDEKVEPNNYLENLPTIFRNMDIDNQLIPLLEIIKPSLADCVESDQFGSFELNK